MSELESLQRHAAELVELVRDRYPGWDGFAHVPFVADEIAFKRKAAQQARKLLGRGPLQQLLAEQAYDEIIGRIERIGRMTNLLYNAQPSSGDLRILYDDNLDKAIFCAQFNDLLHSRQPIETRFDQYVRALFALNLPNTWAFPTCFLFLLHPSAEFFVKPNAAEWFLQFVGAGAAWQRTPSGQVYGLIRKNAHALMAALADYAPRSMIEVQSLVWVARRVSVGNIGRLSTEGQIDLGVPVLREPGSDYVLDTDKEEHDQMIDQLAEPFSRIFASREDAETAFELLRLTIQYLTGEDRDDRRLVLTLPKGSPSILRLNYCSWVVIDFRLHRSKGTIVGLNLITDSVSKDIQFPRSEPFATIPNEPELRYFYEIPISQVSELLPNLERSAAIIAHHFENWTLSNHRRLHQHELYEALFDVNSRQRIFNHGLSAETSLEEVTPPSDIMTETDLLSATLMTENEIDAMLNGLQRKGQIVLYGPPGTGKTFLARKLAAYLTNGDQSRQDLVQFHPAYAYEDFMEGIRPKTSAGQLSYELVPGRFRQFCDHARQRPNDIFVLIIDEINRANLSRVFGELMYLLEYRDETIKLAGGTEFSIPGNVRIIGTMNTADRSIALVDHALRRRFAFIHLQPDFDILRRFHAPTNFPVEPLISLLQELNSDINDPNYAVGISYFLVPDLATQLPAIWQLEIEPYLEERFFGNVETLRRFRWENVAVKLVRPF